MLLSARVTIFLWLRHPEFGGRAKWGATFGEFINEEFSGHGTYMASIAIGAHYSVATAAIAYAVKIADTAGVATESDTIAGIDWVIDEASITGRPSIINASWGGPLNSAVDEAIGSAVRAGIHVVVGAGNDHKDVSGITPAHRESIFQERANFQGLILRSVKSVNSVTIIIGCTLLILHQMEY
jgi:cerevisin